MSLIHTGALPLRGAALYPFLLSHAAKDSAARSCYPGGARSWRIHPRTQVLRRCAVIFLDNELRRAITLLFSNARYPIAVPGNSEQPFAYSARDFIVERAAVVFGCSQSEKLPYIPFWSSTRDWTILVAVAQGRGEGENEADPRARPPPLQWTRRSRWLAARG
ncbi:hypothetical protein K438DRAFT_1782435 [Mycena galopus ATCC 62051]|nr:hypothetical protein K438DRAFT_1791256 [Mycena galopus ATCC 62051]KAF8144813.1 hypothetical protein K438DRAFT_1782435 [Mycena galopus ATCC 62051]